MRSRLCVVAAFVFMLSAVSGCGGGGSSGSIPAGPTIAPKPTAPPAPTPVPASETLTVTLTASGTVAQFAPIESGASASVTFPAASPSVPATVAFQSALPSGLPVPQSKLRRPQSLGASVTALAYLTIEPSSTVTLAGTPGFSFSFPAGTLSGDAYIAFYDPGQSNTGWSVVSGPISATGTNIAFLQSPSSVTLNAKSAYVYAIVETGTPLPTPTPVSTPSPNATASPSPIPTSTPSPVPSPTPAHTPTPVPSPSPTTASSDWSTMGYDLSRSGYNPAERTIGPGSFATLHQIWTANAGGEVGEPVVAHGVSVGGRSTDVVYVPSGGGSIFAINADTGAAIWAKTFTTSAYQCGGNTYSFGIDGSPVIDRATNRIYVGDGAANVHALDLGTGAEAAGWPVSISPAPNSNFISGGLTYNPASGMLYAETSSTCDISPWFGHIAALDTATASVAGSFFPTQGQSGGGIWGFGGASIDVSTNDVFIATGNADTAANPEDFSYAEQIVELSPNVSTVLADNHPYIPPGGDDEDFGATPLLFQPPGCGPLLAAVNKSGMFYLYSRMSISAGPVQAIQMSITTDNGDFIGVPSYDPVTNDVYVGLPATFGIYQPGMAAFAVTPNCTVNPTPVWAAQFGSDGALTGGDTPRSPVTIANGVAYVGDYATNQFYAFNAATGAQLWTQTLSGPGIVGAVVSNGKLYVGSGGRTFTAWSP